MFSSVSYVRTHMFSEDEIEDEHVGRQSFLLMRIFLCSKFKLLRNGTNLT